MRTLSSSLLVAAALLGAASPALAAPAAPPPAAKPAPARPAAAAAAPATGPMSDVRCLMAMVLLAKQPKKEQQQLGQVGMVFFSGRISRGPAQDLGPAMRAEAAAFQPAQVAGELQRCGALVQASMNRVQAGLSTLAPPPGAAAAPAGTPGPAAASPGTPGSAAAAPAPAAAPPIVQTPK